MTVPERPRQPVVVTPKPFYESKTIIANSLVFLIAFLGWVIEASTAGELPWKPDPEMVAIVLTILNVVLRYTTTEPIK